MGIDYETAKWICRHKPAVGSRILTIGRQNWWLSKREARKVGLDKPPAWSRCNYSERFLVHALQCHVHSVDIVADESCDFVCDLSRPDARHKAGSTYDAIMDFGTAEHVANQEVYWNNLYEMLRVGGVLWGMLPADSLCGHGLYQFSPEFAFNLGGFLPLEVAFVTYGFRIRWELLTPISGRFQRRFRWPTFIAFRLRKTEYRFEMPIQYHNATTPTTREKPLARWLVEVPGIRMLERILR